MLSYEEIYEAYTIANLSSDPESAAYINVQDEKTVVILPMDKCSWTERLNAERALKKGTWTQIPDKWDLGLGKELVFRFAENHFTVKEQLKQMFCVKNSLMLSFFFFNAKLSIYPVPFCFLSQFTVIRYLIFSSDALNSLSCRKNTR